MSGIFEGEMFVLYGPEDTAVVRAIINGKGTIVAPGKVKKGTEVMHLAQPGTKLEMLDRHAQLNLINSQWVLESAKAGRILQPRDYFCGVTEEEGSPKRRGDDDDEEEEEEENNQDDDDEIPNKSTAMSMNQQNSATRGRSNKKGEKLTPWTGEEFRILIEYARENKDWFGVSGNKLWEKAEDENILPGRSMQAMRECAKRKRAFIEMEDPITRPRKVVNNESLNNTHLREALDRLGMDANQNFPAVCWAVYQCNGEFKRARKILFGEITVEDFHPWSSEEDVVIAKYARGLLKAEVQSGTNKVKSVLAEHNVTDQKEASNIEVVIHSRDFHEIVKRAKYLVDERSILF